VVYADDVLKDKSGWVVDDGLESLQLWYNETIKCHTKFGEYSINAKKVWCDKYSSWLDRQVKLFGLNLV